MTDARVRVAAYNTAEVYRLHGYVGYEIDLQFETGEAFVGLGAGDIDGVSFVAQDNHLFIKPRAADVRTNLTVLTTRRQYQIDYTSSLRRADATDSQMIYALRFSYPHEDAGDAGAGIGKVLEHSTSERALNLDYWYCGSPAIKPLAVSDDGVHTRLRFGARSEQPAIFVENDDGTESLLNFSTDDGDVIVHRVVRQLVVRRGRLSGRIVNRMFDGGGQRLESGTVSPEVERTTEGIRP
jgi:type IV secretion system protein VirB9